MDAVAVNIAVGIVSASVVGAVNVFVLRPLSSIPDTLHKIERDLDGILAREPLRNDQLIRLENRIERQQRWISRAHEIISQLRVERDMRNAKQLQSRVDGR